MIQSILLWIAIGWIAFVAGIAFLLGGLGDAGTYPAQLDPLEEQKQEEESQEELVALPKWWW